MEREGGNEDAPQCRKVCQCDSMAPRYGKENWSFDCLTDPEPDERLHYEGNRGGGDTRQGHRRSQQHQDGENGDRQH